MNSATENPAARWIALAKVAFTQRAARGGVGRAHGKSHVGGDRPGTRFAAAVGRTPGWAAKIVAQGVMLRLVSRHCFAITSLPSNINSAVTS